jgi:hypothetical protein
MDSTGATIETPLYLMEEVQIGHNTFAPHKVVAIDLEHVNSKIEIPMDFILGFSTLKQAHWIFDFPKKQWAISKMINLKD